MDLCRVPDYAADRVGICGEWMGGFFFRSDSETTSVLGSRGGRLFTNFVDIYTPKTGAYSTYHESWQVGSVLVGISAHESHKRV